MNLSILSPDEALSLLELEKSSFRPAAIRYFEQKLEEKRQEFLLRCEEIGHIDLEFLDEMVVLRRKLDHLLAIWADVHLTKIQQPHTKRPKN